MANQHATGCKRLKNALYFSIAGFKAVWRYEEAFRQELVLLIIMTPLALWLGQGVIEALLLIGVLVLILITELINSAIEAVVDRIGTEQHVLSGRAKDIGSATVMLSMLWAVITWLIILFN